MGRCQGHAHNEKQHFDARRMLLQASLEPKQAQLQLPSILLLRLHSEHPFPAQPKLALKASAQITPASANNESNSGYLSYRTFYAMGGIIFLRRPQCEGWSKVGQSIPRPHQLPVWEQLQPAHPSLAYARQLPCMLSLSHIKLWQKICYALEPYNTLKAAAKWSRWCRCVVGRFLVFASIFRPRNRYLLVGAR